MAVAASSVGLSRRESSYVTTLRVVAVMASSGLASYVKLRIVMAVKVSCVKPSQVLETQGVSSFEILKTFRGLVGQSGYV